MKTWLFAVLCILATACAAIAADPPIVVTSSAFPPAGKIPERFTCKGANENPPIHIRRLPAGAKSLVLIMDDPDAPDRAFNHWLIWNIAPTARAIETRILPAGAVEGKNDFGKIGYGGPCPPSLHRYFFRVFALDQMLDLKAGARRTDLEHAMAGHILAQGLLTGQFGG